MMRTRRGTALTQWLVLAAATATAGAGMLLFARNLAHRRGDDDDASRMRRVYVAMAMYQDENGGRPPADLTEAVPYGGATDLRSDRDPFIDSAREYPIEPTLPNLPGRAPYRISFGFLGNYLRAGLAPIRSWSETDVRTAVLANPWAGTSAPTGRPFEATVDGPVQRILADGSLETTPNGSGLGYDRLFGRSGK